MATVLAGPSLATRTPGTQRAGLWTGRVLTGLVVAFLVVDAVAKLVPLAAVVAATQRLGIGDDLVRPIGVLLLASTLLHAVRRTQALGALLVTAYLGGATATHVLTGTPGWFPVTLGVLLWAAYALRSPRLRAFVLSTR